jgi:hypothetical protein
MWRLRTGTDRQDVDGRGGFGALGSDGGGRTRKDLVKRLRWFRWVKVVLDVAVEARPGALRKGGMRLGGWGEDVLVRPGLDRQAQAVRVRHP